MLDEKLQDVAREINAEIQASGNDGALLAITDMGGRLSASIVGSEDSLILALAKTINENKDLEKIINAAMAAAPIVKMLFGEGRPSADCDCPNCVARRKAAGSNPNVN